MKKIFLFTHSFPFTLVGETFIEPEIQIAAKLDIELTLVPLYSSSNYIEIPANVNINKKLSNITFFKKIIIFLKMLTDPLFFNLIVCNKKTFRSWDNFYNSFKYLYGGLLIKSFLISNKEMFPSGSILYSFWFNYTVLGFALAKNNCDHFKTCKFYSRAHRYDLYAENRGIFIPFREKMLNCLDRLFAVSMDGVNYLREELPCFSLKIDLGRLGIIPLINNIKDKESKKVDISLISCSNVIPLKRTSLIFKSINLFCEENPQLKVSWIHIGDGIEMKILKELVNTEKTFNLTVNLTGYKFMSEIMEILTHNEFDAFINLSLSEGLPVTLMMAISAGIPLIATDAGGTKEIVTRETGCLLPVSFSQEEFSKAVLFCVNNEELRKSCHSFFLENFSAIKNYSDFYQRL
ncbi:MAG TPA: glycosyltransferase [Bacteroidales bacterium]|nr:glycosyltransferase [Bacteroidales bacterium]